MSPWVWDAGEKPSDSILSTKPIFPFGRQPVVGRELKNLIFGKYKTIIFVRDMNFTFINVIAPPASGRADDFSVRP